MHCDYPMRTAFLIYALLFLLGALAWRTQAYSISIDGNPSSVHEDALITARYTGWENYTTVDIAVVRYGSEQQEPLRIKHCSGAMGFCVLTLEGLHGEKLLVLRATPYLQDSPSAFSPRHFAVNQAASVQAIVVGDRAVGFMPAPKAAVSTRHESRSVRPGASILGDPADVCWGDRITVLWTGFSAFPKVKITVVPPTMSGTFYMADSRELYMNLRLGYPYTDGVGYFVEVSGLEQNPESSDPNDLRENKQVYAVTAPFSLHRCRVPAPSPSPSLVGSSNDQEEN